ncbi:MAG: phosphoglycolate phosphatase [Xanthomonadaceae bacterium]|nr:phosphoglycolate phosphatase [Xanthomonadaceae bacterium]MDE1958298.1 phosphoglycolate phosphatase [Xanthomonadaceae bacterium]MDE2178457.1 phosphoglycolate phosphatase [Xanthomonadaceae bacterium]MDE2245236.1 phosphoglycolate phosphatase [Xanthomonadaceae bacterium]
MDRPLAAAVDGILFDLDGTLADTVPDLLQATNDVLAGLGLAPLDAPRIRGMIGTGERDLMRQALAAVLRGPPAEPLLEQAYRAFDDAYAQANGRHSRLYDGVESGLRRLHDLDLPLAVVTNKPHAFSVALLRSLGVADRFAVIVGGDSTPLRKPQALPLLHACAQLGIAPMTALMVGDSPIDVAAARAANCRAVCVTYGYTRGRDPREFGVPLLSRIDALPALLQTAWPSDAIAAPRFPVP